MIPIAIAEASAMYRDNGGKPFSFLMTSGVQKTTYQGAAGGLYAVAPDMWRPKR